MIVPPVAELVPAVEVDPVTPERGQDDLPDARLFAQNLARCVVEVLAGTRQLDQLARWITDDVYAHLLLRDSLARRGRAARGETPARLALTMGSTVMSTPVEGVVDAVVIIHGRARSRAVALRLETFGARWRASAIHVL